MASSPDHFLQFSYMYGDFGSLGAVWDLLGFVFLSGWCCNRGPVTHCVHRAERLNAHRSHLRLVVVVRVPVRGCGWCGCSRFCACMGKSISAFLRALKSACMQLLVRYVHALLHSFPNSGVATLCHPPFSAIVPQGWAGLQGRTCAHVQLEFLDPRLSRGVHATALLP
eukprot:scaffold56787_cov21-Tisochrysis_lutea.AAC.2